MLLLSLFLIVASMMTWISIFCIFLVTIAPSHAELSKAILISYLSRCMEATPSLACANKCVFCWRHHTNPVGKSWRWKMDNPLEIVDVAIDEHTKMIKQMKGVPGECLASVLF